MKNIDYVCRMSLMYNSVLIILIINKKKIIIIASVNKINSKYYCVFQ